MHVVQMAWRRRFEKRIVLLTTSAPRGAWPVGFQVSHPPTSASVFFRREHVISCKALSTG